MTPREEVSDAEVLRQAAARVRTTLTATESAAPWRVDAVKTGVVLGADGIEVVDSGDFQGDTAWIALLGPQVALPLAAWLEDEAKEHERAASYASAGLTIDKALATARALLGLPGRGEGS